MLDFHRQIGPEGTIIVIVGAVKTEQAVEQVRAIYEDWSNPNQPAPPRVAAPVARPPEVAQRFVPIPGKSQADIVFGYPGPARNAPDYQAARMANNILGRFGMYGRLGDNIREDQGLAYYSYSTLTGGLGPGPWQVSAGVAPENVEKTIESIRREIRRMTDEPVTDEELADNKSYFKGHLVLGLETNDGVSSTLLNMELYELGLDYLQKYASMIDAITVEDVQRASQQYLDADAYVVAVAGPPGK
jgi:zinc protease